MVSLEEALVAPGATDTGENEQLAPLGRFPQVSATELPKLPSSADTVMVVCTVCPVFVLMLAGEAETA
jgi:hypothetical protein